MDAHVSGWKWAFYCQNDMHSTHTTKVHVYNETCKHWCSKHIYTISKLVGTLYTVHWNANLRHQRWGATCHRHSDRSEQCYLSPSTTISVYVFSTYSITNLPYLHYLNWEKDGPAQNCEEEWRRCRLRWYGHEKAVWQHKWKVNTAVCGILP